MQPLPFQNLQTKQENCLGRISHRPIRSRYRHRYRDIDTDTDAETQIQTHIQKL